MINRCKWCDRNLLFTSAIAFLVIACGQHKNEEEKSISEPPAAVTELIQARKGQLSTSLQVPGELIAFQQVDIYAKENSFVKKVLVDVGSEVKQGQLLVTMEAPELGSQLTGALSNIKSREAAFTASKANYDRLVATSKTPGTISPNDLEQAEARKNAAQAELESARAAYDQVVQTQNYLQIRAPFGGIITSRNVNAGAYVGPSGRGSDQPLFTLQEQKKLRLIVSVPEAYSTYLRPETEVNFSVRALPNRDFKAKIKRLAGALDTRFRAQRIEMDVTNDDKILLPGMVADVRLPLPARDSAVVVPKSAVVNSTESIFVIAMADSTAKWIPVKKGRENNGVIEVYGNVNAGDLLVKNGTDEIKDGSKIRNAKLVNE